GMDIGTAKITAEQQLVPHFGIDLLDPSHSYSAAEYQDYARTVIQEQAAANRGVPPVVCGGTGLYLRAALDDFSFPQQETETQQSADNQQLDTANGGVTPLRQHYEDMYAQLQQQSASDNSESRKQEAAHKLHDLLAQRDPASAEVIHPHNVRRTIRALELQQQGLCYSDIKQAFKTRRSYLPTQWIGIDCDRELLYQRIDQRVDKMMQDGLLAEVEHLLAAGYEQALTATQAIGYKELVPVVQGSADQDIAVAAIKQATRRYAKRQLSWFRCDPRISWLRYDTYQLDDLAARTNELIAELTRRRP
ncbi:MAG: tRNA (adenosine(37)-N6)-dimethylallyltransferase MiaA, partial [Coriobacteriia bacterium]|nr:tRNA (adenosine(37)-N6)-dimethylallyltransferase MiaA [Coriobacteriia bacterium]